MHRLRRGVTTLEILQVHVDGHVADEFRELAIHQDLGKRLAQRIAGLAADLRDVVDKTAERAVLGDPLGGRLLAHSRDAREVVARVAPERGEIRVLGRGQPVLLLDRIGRHAREVGDSLAGVENRGGGRHELEGVAVAGDDRGLHAGRLRLRGQRGDEVVGLVAVALEVANAHGREDVTDEVHLPAKLLRGLGSRCLVALERLAAEGGSRHVERDRDMRGIQVAQCVDEHGRESVDGVRRLSRHGREILDRKGVEGPVREGVPVQKEKPSRCHSPILGRGSQPSRARPASASARLVP